MHITKGVEALELKMNMMGIHTIIYPTLIWDEENVIMFDAGLPSSVPEIQKGMAQVGVPIKAISKVFISHQDLDHMGGLPELIGLSEDLVEVLAHEEERPYIQGDKPLLRMNPEQIKKIMATLPEEERKRMEKTVQETMRFKYPKVDRTVSDGEVLPYCGGITVIHTPGHTPGHICLYLNKSKTLIAGDALDVIDGKLFGPKPGLSADELMAYNSIKKFYQYDIEKVVCYHGGLYKDNVNQRLLELTKDLK